MIRAPIGIQSYWDDSFEHALQRLVAMKVQIADPAGDQSYRPQYIFEFAKNHWHLLLTSYSRGDDISELAQYFPPLLDAWEQSELLGASVWTDAQKHSRRAWRVNLDHYIICFWLVGLALALEIPDEQWHRLVALAGNEGEDALLDRIIATRTGGRRIGAGLCHPKPYQRLLDAVNAPQDQQAKLLSEFVSNWYKDLNRPPKKGLSGDTTMYDRPYWYTLGNKQLHDSGYFGRWCIEAVAAVKAFGLDDSLCLGHEHYPGDLLRPSGATTHLIRVQTASPENTPQQVTQPAVLSPKPNLLGRLFGKKQP